MMKAYNWYSQLIRPSWAPPSWVFGPVWTVLYAVIAISYTYVLYLFFTHRIPFMVAVPFLLNLLFNVIFTPIQFGLKNNALASADILLVLGTLVWAIVAIHRYVPWVSYVNLPYLGWVCFATVLQITITFLNK